MLAKNALATDFQLSDYEGVGAAFEQMRRQRNMRSTHDDDLAPRPKSVGDLERTLRLRNICAEADDIEGTVEIDRLNELVAEGDFENLWAQVRRRSRWRRMRRASHACCRLPRPSVANIRYGRPTAALSGKNACCTIRFARRLSQHSLRRRDFREELLQRWQSSEKALSEIKALHWPRTASPNRAQHTEPVEREGGVAP